MKTTHDMERRGSFLQYMQLPSPPTRKTETVIETGPVPKTETWTRTNMTPEATTKVDTKAKMRANAKGKAIVGSMVFRGILFRQYLSQPHQPCTPV